MKRYKSVVKKINEGTSKSVVLAQNIVNEINKVFGKSILKVKLTDDNSKSKTDKTTGVDREIISLSFEFIYQMNPSDPFIDTSLYSNGKAYIYPTKKALQTVNEILTRKYGFEEVDYSNTGTTFWVMKEIEG